MSELKVWLNPSSSRLLMQKVVLQICHAEAVDRLTNIARLEYVEAISCSTHNHAGYLRMPMCLQQQGKRFQAILDWLRFRLMIQSIDDPIY